jgi:hypothetical protein
MSADRNSENVFDFDNPDYYINATVGFDKKKKKMLQLVLFGAFVGRVYQRQQ